MRDIKMQEAQRYTQLTRAAIEAEKWPAAAWYCFQAKIKAAGVAKAYASMQFFGNPHPLCETAENLLNVLVKLGAQIPKDVAPEPPAQDSHSLTIGELLAS